MLKKKWWKEDELLALAKGFRKQAGKNRAQAAREMGVSQTSIFNAEESPSQSLLKLRMRLIEAYSPYKVVNRIFLIKKGRRAREATSQN